ncbi:MAG: hypothetical protein RR861_13810 [Glutamicibacter sp.]|uniref:hypothetical protein n=1 Tax=Glutamicibacter sp. TaxID=1931995 RepID=UPI002FC7535F
MYQLIVAARMIPGVSSTFAVSQSLHPAIRTATNKKFRSKNSSAQSNSAPVAADAFSTNLHASKSAVQSEQQGSGVSVLESDGHQCDHHVEEHQHSLDGEEARVDPP